MPRPRISIALATYNGTRYLPEQLGSFAAQHQPPDEVVVCDDASSDDTLAVVEAFRATAPFEVRILRNDTNLGYSPTFEVAISNCTGDIIFTSDQDDVWFPEKISTIVPLFEQHARVMVLVHDHIIVNHDLTHSGVTKLQNIRSLGLDSASLRSGCSTAFRRQWLDLVLPIPHQAVPYDHWIDGLAVHLGVRLVVPKALLYYRRHASNTTGWIASSPTTVSQLDLALRYGLRDTRPGWGREVDARKAYIRRLQDQAGQLRTLGLGDRAAGAIDRLHRAIEARQARTALVSLPRWSRAPRVLQFLLAGQYRQFSGWRSAVKDLVRP